MRFETTPVQNNVIYLALVSPLVYLALVSP